MWPFKKKHKCLPIEDYSTLKNWPDGGKSALAECSCGKKFQASYGRMSFSEIWGWEYTEIKE